MQERGPATLRRGWSIGLAAVLLAGLLAAGWTWWQQRPFPLPEGTDMAGAPAPTFSLTDQFGKPLALADLRGRLVVLTFIDSRCTDVCEFQARELAQVRDALGPQREQVALVAINANPRATGVADVLAYSRQFRMAERWYFLTADPAALERVWKDYYVGVQVDAQGQVTHQVAVYIIDGRGRERALLLPRGEPIIRADRILADLRPLL